MSVRIRPTSFLPEMFGEVVDMPTPTLYVVKTNHGCFTYHDDEIAEFFYA